METVEITIRVTVPKKHKYVAVDQSGVIYTYKNKPERFHTTSDGGFWDCPDEKHPDGAFSKRSVANWRNTLVNVVHDKQGDPSQGKLGL